MAGQHHVGHLRRIPRCTRSAPRPPGKVRKMEQTRGAVPARRGLAPVVPVAGVPPRPGARPEEPPPSAGTTPAPPQGARRASPEAVTPPTRQRAPRRSCGTLVASTRVAQTHKSRRTDANTSNTKYSSPKPHAHQDTQGWRASPFIARAARKARPLPVRAPPRGI